MSDYFNYDILYVMNITDIDDKIIKRARQNHLYDNYVSEHHDVERILSDAQSVLKTFENTLKTTNDPDKKNMYQKMLERIKNSLEKLESSVKSKNESQINESVKVLIHSLLTFKNHTLHHFTNYFMDRHY